MLIFCRSWLLEPLDVVHRVHHDLLYLVEYNPGAEVSGLQEPVDIALVGVVLVEQRGTFILKFLDLSH